MLAVPCLIFRTLGQADIPAVQPWGYWIAYFAGRRDRLGARHADREPRSSRARAPGSWSPASRPAQSNTVFVGVPMILKAYGDAGAVPLFLLLAVHLPVTMTIATLLVEGRTRLRRRCCCGGSSPIRSSSASSLGSAARPVVDLHPGPLWTHGRPARRRRRALRPDRHGHRACAATGFESGLACRLISASSSSACTR